MPKAKNKIIAGDYEGKNILLSGKNIQIESGFIKKITLDKSTVEQYELLTDEHRKSASNGIVKGLVGNFLLGPVGAIGGVLSAKSKGIYQVAIQFKDGKRSLLEIDDKIYQTLIKKMF